MSSPNSTDEVFLPFCILKDRQQNPLYRFGDRPGPFSLSATWQQERRDVLESVLDALRAGDDDADLAAACSWLLRHLIRTAPGEKKAVGGQPSANSVRPLTLAVPGGAPREGGHGVGGAEADPLHRERR